MNVQDSERMLDLLSPLGYRETGEAEEADLIILNSCHIREKAAEKIYSDLGRLRKKRRAGSVVAVGGCVGQAEGEEILRRASGNVDMVFGPQNFHKLPMMLRNHRARPNAPLLETALSAAEKFRALAPRRAPSSVSAFLTIQEGCDRFCAFCVVPYTRGAEMSRAVGAIEDEAARLVAMGAKEIVLLGQNVNAYRGRQGAQSLGLGALIKRLSKIPNLLRIRYTTSHPKDMDASLIAAHGEEEKLMPFLHLPVQSGSDRILSLMNRRHGVDFYWDLVKRLRGARKDLALSSDFIVGFPGESEEDFEATLDLARRVRFAQAYSFKYSARPGTPAALAKIRSLRTLKPAVWHACAPFLMRRNMISTNLLKGAAHRFFSPIKGAARGK